MSYLVKEDGQVYSERSGKILKRFKLNGKWCVKAWGTNYYIHKMLWEQHGGKVEYNMVLTFKDGNPDNLTIGNLVKVNRNTYYVRCGGDFPYCYEEQGGHDWKRFICRFNGKVVISTKKSDYILHERFGSKVFNREMEMEDFYRKFAVDALATVIPDQVYMLPGFDGRYELHTNSGVKSGHEYNGVILDLKTSKWIFYNPKIKYVPLIHPDGSKKYYNIPELAYRVIYSDDDVKNIGFRCEDKPYLFDLIKK